MIVVVEPHSVLALTAREHSQAHQPFVRRDGAYCRTCDDAWPCDVRAVAESVLRAAGIDPRAFDDLPARRRKPLPRHTRELVAR